MHYLLFLCYWSRKNGGIETLIILTWCPFLQRDLHPQEAHERGTTVAHDGGSGQDQQEDLPTYPTIPLLLEKVENNAVALPSSLEEQQDVAALESKFVLPDLNIPFGEDSSNEILCGVNWDTSE